MNGVLLVSFFGHHPGALVWLVDELFLGLAITTQEFRPAGLLLIADFLFTFIGMCVPAMIGLVLIKTPVAR